MFTVISIGILSVALAHQLMEEKRLRDRAIREEQERREHNDRVWEENQRSMERMGMRIQNAQDRSR